jgi:peroxiredoxin
MKWFRNIFGGQDMAALTAGTTAPDFDLKTVEGREFSLQDALSRGPVVIAFFKVSCPVCQYTFPFIERIYKAHGSPKITFVGISQNNKKDTTAFIKEYGVTFPVLLDDPNTYPVSNAYGLTNVPTIFWIAQDGEIEISCVGWDRKDVDDVNRRAAESTGGVLKSIFHAGEDVPEFRGG